MTFDVFADFKPDEPTFQSEPMLRHPGNVSWGEFCRLGQAAMDVMEANHGHLYDGPEIKILEAGFRMGFMAGFRVGLENS